MTRRLTHIIFDLDGTLTDPKEGITRSIEFALLKLGLESPSLPELARFIGPPLASTFGQLLESSDKELIGRAIAHYRERFTSVGMFENRVYPDVPATLQALKVRGFQLFVATSKPRVFAETILQHFELHSFFVHIYGSELDGTLSDKVELVAHLLRSEGIDPSTALMVGDREHDIFGGQKNGIKTAAVFYGYGSREELELTRPDFRLEGISGLKSLLFDLR